MRRTNTYTYIRGRWKITQKEKFEPIHRVFTAYYFDGEEIDNYYSNWVAPRWHLDAYIDRKEEELCRG